MKGRIIGREGRNIRAFENLTGIDFIIDDTPEAVVLSGFDRVRREIARLTLTKLITDGRIHPARIEETSSRRKAEVEAAMEEAGEQACFDTNVHGVAPELVKLLGRLKYRTSYGQNVLKHSIEVAHLAGIMAAELGANVEDRQARRPAARHRQGRRPRGRRLARGRSRQQLCQEVPRVAERVHAIQAHHQDVEPQTIEAVLVQAADAISAARPGARRETLENYIKRLESLEQHRREQEGRGEVLRHAGRARGARHGQAGRDRRRRDRAAGARDRPRDRGPARLPGPDPRHRHPREPRRRHRQVARDAAPSARPRRDGMTARYYLRSFGCQMNEHDAERIRALLEAEGLERADAPDDADVLVYNTCTVRKSADDRLAGHLGTAARLKRERPGRVVARDRLPAAGRAGRPSSRASRSSTAPSARRTCTACRSCCGGRRAGRRGRAGFFEDGPRFSGDLAARRERPFQAWVQVMRGCTNFCSYCIVPYVRGPERSRPLDERRRRGARPGRRRRARGHAARPERQRLRRATCARGGEAAPDFAGAAARARRLAASRASAS